MSAISQFTALVRSRPYSIRRRLLRDLLLLIVLTSGTLFAVTSILSVDIRQDIVQSQISSAATQATQDFRRLFEPVTKALQIVKKWGSAGDLDAKDFRALNFRFVPMLEQMPQITGMMIADANGLEYFLLRKNDEWLTRSTVIEGSESSVVWRRWSPELELLREWSEVSDYDPRSRPWYQGAFSTARDDGIFWSKPYVFYTLKAPGVTASTRWRKDDHSGDHVVAFDVLLNDIAGALAKLRPSEHGRALLIDDEGAVFVPPVSNDAQRPSVGRGAFFQPAADFDAKVVFETTQAWKTQDRPAEESFRFDIQGATWWARFLPLYPDNRSLWFGVTTPESDFIGEVQKKWGVIASVGLAVLLVGVVLAGFLVFRYGRQLKNLPKLSIDSHDFENEVLSLVRAGETSVLEFKSTMRMNLKAGRPGKEIELAWLKTVVAFMNTNGGILLIGVDDAGSILGIEPDGFENEDRCRLHFKNLFQQHIGLEFSKFVHFDLQPVYGKQVIVVECERAKVPVFLSARNEESFFIRSGPSSVKLSISKTLVFLQHRR
ncbi:MAG: ATP-binding protein [Gammaproteobacteria bacterium]|nr:ATP-binding protein [Gammaproteobacteria bacterium]